MHGFGQRAARAPADAGPAGWIELSLEVDRDVADAVSERLESLGALAVTLRDAADDALYEPAPGATPLWRRTRVTGLFPANVDLDALLDELGTGAVAAHRVCRLEDRAWEREWLEHYRPMRFGRRLWVGPIDAAVPPGMVAVHLDPGLAFGTGTHPSTALCLEWLDAIDPAGLEVVDYGCGSGILACAAARLGAARVRAVDVDPQALLATRENARRNGVAGTVETLAPAALADGAADVVVANILADVLVTLAPRLVSLLRPRGRLALAGILAAQGAEVAAAYAPLLDLEPPVERDGWVRLSGRRR